MKLKNTIKTYCISKIVKNIFKQKKAKHCKCSLKYLQCTIGLFLIMKDYLIINQKLVLKNLERINKSHQNTKYEIKNLNMLCVFFPQYDTNSLQTLFLGIKLTTSQVLLSEHFSTQGCNINLVSSRNLVPGKVK